MATAGLTIAEDEQGPMFIGFIFNTTLLGLLSLQVHAYSRAYKSDAQWIRIFVYSLYTINVLNTVFIAIYLYTAVIIHFGDEHYLATATWAFDTTPAMTGIIAAMVQLFYAWRLTILTRSFTVPAAIVVTTLLGLVGALVTTYYCTSFMYFEDFVEFKAWPIVWLISGCVSDVIITISLVCHLQRHKTGDKRTDALVDKIVRLTVPTGALTAVVAIVAICVYLVPGIHPAGLHHLFNFPLSKLYSVSLMSSLTSRMREGSRLGNSGPTTWSVWRSRGDRPTTMVSDMVLETRSKVGDYPTLDMQCSDIHVNVERTSTVDYDVDSGYGRSPSMVRDVMA